MLPGSREGRRRREGAATRDLAPALSSGHSWGQMQVSERRAVVSPQTLCPQVSRPESPGERTGLSVDEGELGSKDLAPWEELRFQSGQ